MNPIITQNRVQVLAEVRIVDEKITVYILAGSTE